jgi:hypothetical protein
MENQQQLPERNTYTPSSASQAGSSVAVSLNKEETLNEHGLKTSGNGLDVNLRQRTGGLTAKVFVLNRDGKPLMPCTPAKARHLLEHGKAKVRTVKPFTIQLNWDCEHNVQKITLGIDAGYSNIGYSAVSNKEELISGEIRLRKDVSKKLRERRMYRKEKSVKLKEFIAKEHEYYWRTGNRYHAITWNWCIMGKECSKENRKSQKCPSLLKKRAFFQVVLWQ